MEKILGVLIRKGVQVRVYGTCINTRGLALSELVDSVELGSMNILMEWIRDSY
jgi:sulfur relay (sulfurtransferase) complex TusBCD TusD component (DsrE family)